MSVRRVQLPSGLVAHVRIDRGARTGTSKERVLYADMLALLASDRFVVQTGEPPTRLDARAVDALALRDFHVLRDLAIRSKLLPSEKEIVACDNCDAELVFDPSALPVEDLDDRYEDEEQAREVDVSLEKIRVRMRPVTVREARPLWHELRKNRGLDITPKLLGAMGVVRIEPDVSDLRLVAKRLRALSDESWSRIEEAFLDLAYPPRAIASITCARCETVHDMEVPWPRELEPGLYRRSRAEGAPFPDATDFEARAWAVADATFRRMNAGGLTLRVELGVPEVDAGGVPMLGSYTDEPREDGGTDFVVRLYYQTFERSFREDVDFDWSHELDETIEHEAQHHLYYLSGHDPMDAQERAESERHLIRRVGGDKRYRKLQQRALLSGVWEIVRVLVPALALVALAVVVLSRCAE